METQKMGNFIAKLRHENNWTQKDLAEKIGISDKAVSKWECGNSIPDIATMQKLCQIFEISVNDLISGEKISSENFDKKAEENIMKLMEENEKAKNQTLWNKIGTLIGLLSANIIFLVTCLSAGQINHLYLYLDIPSIMIVLGLVLLFIATSGLLKPYFRGFVIIFTGAKNLSQEEINKIYVAHHYGKNASIAAGILGSIIGIIACLTILANESGLGVLGPNLAIACLTILYGIILYIISLYIEMRTKIMT